MGDVVCGDACWLVNDNAVFDQRCCMAPSCTCPLRGSDGMPSPFLQVSVKNTVRVRKSQSRKGGRATWWPPADLSNLLSLFECSLHEITASCKLDRL